MLKVAVLVSGGLKQFKNRYKKLKMYFMLAPNAANILEDKLPAFVKTADQNQYIDNFYKEIQEYGYLPVDVRDKLKEYASDGKTQLYYRTDHHWTTQGAFYVFQDAAETLGIEGDVSDDFVSYTVTDSFNGVLAASSGVGLDEMEQIDIYAPTGGDDDVVVNYVDEGRKTTSLYDSSKLETRDKYGVFLGGNTSVVDIRTVSTSQKRLLVVKDSFADCFIPFLAPYYREIVVVDPRYYSGTMQDIMDSYRITDALILYSGNTFFTDNNISGVFTGE